MTNQSKLDKIRIFGVLNHLGNQYEMLKLAKKYPVKFSYLENNVRKWSSYSHRPLPTDYLTEDQFEWVQSYEPGKYDVAILHVDQQHTDPDIGKGWLYRDLNEIIQDIPKMVINHGTPMWDERYTEEMVINGGEIQTDKGVKKLIGMKEKIGDNFMVVNSYEAVERWGWGYPLIHGFDPNQWWDLPKEPRITISLSSGGLDKYYNRQLLTAIKGAVFDKTGFNIQHVGINFKAENWNEYRDFMGRSLIQIYPFKDSPMPRSRTEAMLSGSCILTSKYHGAEDFFEHGVDGFIVPDNPMSYADVIYQTINFHYKEAEEMGQRAKRKARKLFHIDRYLDDLYYIINEVAQGRKPEWNGEKKMVRFFTFEQFHNKKNIGSTKIRVHNLIKYWSEADLYKYGEKPEVLIFQKVYCTYDYKLPVTYPGITILDACDIDWNTGPDIHIKETLNGVDAVTVPTKNLQKLLSQLTDKPVEIIKDRFDLSEFPAKKIHKGKAKTVVWFGYSHNAELMNWSIPSLEKRGLNLIVISDSDPQLFRFATDSQAYQAKYQYIKYDKETIYKDIQKADICVLPKGARPQDRYKSENKTVIAQLCGLPVATNADELDKLINADVRNRRIDTIYDKLKQEYDCRVSVEEYKNLIKRIGRIR